MLLTVVFIRCSTPGAAAVSLGSILPSDSMEKPQWGEGGAYIHSVQQDETKGPLHPLLSALGHEGWDPQHTATEALKPLQEAVPPLFADQVLEGPLHHRRVHGHQVSPPPHVLIVFLHWSQVAPKDKEPLSFKSDIISHEYL